MIFDYQFRNYNFRALIYMILLSVLGILVVGSASNQDRSSVIKQIIGVVVSLIICLVLSLIDYHQYFFGIISKFIEVQMKPGQSMSGFYL